jgi:hypothetical protein
VAAARWTFLSFVTHILSVCRCCFFDCASTAGPGRPFAPSGLQSGLVSVVIVRATRLSLVLPTVI